MADFGQFGFSASRGARPDGEEDINIVGTSGSGAISVSLGELKVGNIDDECGSSSLWQGSTDDDPMDHENIGRRKLVKTFRVLAGIKKIHKFEFGFQHRLAHLISKVETAANNDYAEARTEYELDDLGTWKTEHLDRVPEADNHKKQPASVLASFQSSHELDGHPWKRKCLEDSEEDASFARDFRQFENFVVKEVVDEEDGGCAETSEELEVSMQDVKTYLKHYKTILRSTKSPVGKRYDQLEKKGVFNSESIDQDKLFTAD